MVVVVNCSLCIICRLLIVGWLVVGWLLSCVFVDLLVGCWCWLLDEC